MKNNIFEEIKKIQTMMGVKPVINEGLNLGRIFSNVASIADDLLVKIIQNTEKLTDLAALAAKKDGTKTETQWLSELRSTTRKDWEDLLEYTGKLKFLFSNPHSAIIYLVENSSKAADDVMSWFERTDVKDLDKQEVKDLLEAVRFGKGWSKESPGYKEFKQRGKMPENITWVNTKSTKSATKYFTDISDEEIFRAWINLFEDGKYAKKYNIDLFQPGVTKSDWAGLGEALKDPDIIRNWLGASQQKALAQKFEGVWGLPKSKMIRNKIFGKDITVKVPASITDWIKSKPKVFQYGVGTIAVLATMPTWLPWLISQTARGTAEAAEETYKQLQLDIEGYLAAMKEDARDGALVRNIFNETVTMSTLSTKYPNIVWSSYNLITDEQAQEIAKSLIIPSFKQPDKTEIPKFSSELIFAIRNRIYSSVPDGLALIKVVEEFKKLAESNGKNPRDYYFDKLTYAFTFADNKELSENSYIDMTNAPSGEGMVMSIMLPAQILSIGNKKLEYTTDFWKKLKTTQISINAPKIDEQELLETKKKIDVLINPKTWVMKPNAESARYKGISLNDFSDWGESCANIVGTSDKLESVLKKAVVQYLEFESRKSIEFKDLFNTDKIVTYVNSVFPCSDFKGRLDYADPEILTKGELENKDYTPPQPTQEPKPVTPKPVTPKPVTPQPERTRESKNSVGLSKLLTEQNAVSDADFDWQAALFQNYMDFLVPEGWKGTPKKKVNKDRKNGYGQFDTETMDKYADYTDKGKYSKSEIEQVEKYFFPMYNKKFLFELNDSGDFITLDSNQVYAKNILNILNYTPVTPFEVIFYIGIMKVKEIANQVTAIQVSDATEKILNDNQKIITQILNPKNK